MIDHVWKKILMIFYFIQLVKKNKSLACARKFVGVDNDFKIVWSVFTLHQITNSISTIFMLGHFLSVLHKRDEGSSPLRKSLRHKFIKKTFILLLFALSFSLIASALDLNTALSHLLLFT
jgi:hypothetical protein